MSASLLCLPAPLRSVLELFAAELSAVAFPDVDATVLHQHAEEVAARHRAVEAARASLDQATAELAARTHALATLAERGLAYARIYSSAHPERDALAAGLAQLELHDAPLGAEATAAAPKRGRKRAPRPELPFETSSSSSSSSSAPSQPAPAASTLEATSALERGDRAGIEASPERGDRASADAGTDASDRA